MKQAPQMENFDDSLRSSALVAGGFMGDDPRSVAEVIDVDAGELFRLGITQAQLAARMKEITEAAAQAQETWVRLDAQREALVEESRGLLPCPWPHPGQYLKRVTTVRLIETGESIRWSELSLHLIAEHGFFEGKGSPFRMEPAVAARVLF